MGIVKRQGVKSSILTYLGFLLGAANLFVIYTQFLSEDELGLIQVFVALATPFISLSSLGMINVISRFFPYYQRLVANERNDLLSFSFGFSLLGFIFFGLLAYFNQSFIFTKFNRSPLLVDFFYLLPAFAGGLLTFELLRFYTNQLGFSALGVFCNQLLYRLVLGGLVLLFGLKVIGFQQMMLAYSLSYWLLSAVLVVKLIQEKAWHWAFRFSVLTRRLKKQIRIYASYYLGVRLLASSSIFIDVIAVTGLLGLKEAGVYTVAIYFVSLILVPQRAIIYAVIPLISEAWSRNDLKQINTIYHKSSEVLLVTGGLLYLLICFSMDHALAFLPKAYQNLLPVFVVLGGARLVDMVSGVNVQILANSKRYFRMDFWSSLVLLLIQIPLNYWLIKSHGTIGAAWALLISFVAINGLRGWYLYQKEGLLPFKKSVWKILVLYGLNGIVMYGLYQAIDTTSFSLVQHFLFGAIKSMVLLAVNLPLIYSMKVSNDLNQMIDQGLKRLKFTSKQ